MPIPFTNETWAKRIDRALQLPDLAELFDNSRLRRDQIPALLGKSEQDVLSAASEEGRLAKDRRDALNDALKRVEQSEQGVKKRFKIPTYTGLLILSVVVVSGFVVALSTSWKVLLSSSYIYSILAAVVVFFALPILDGQLEERSRRSREKRLDEKRKELNIEDLRLELAKAQDRYEDALVEKGLGPELRGALHKSLTPSYSLTLGDYTDRGLSEVYDSANEISTRAKEKLDQLLTLPGGAIGVAGPRGAGKSTLLQSVKNREAPKGEKPFCNVLCSAPVEYAARDFILNLFSIVCLKVLNKEYEEVEDTKVRDSQPTHPFESSFATAVMAYGPALGLTAGSCLLVIGLALGFAGMPPRTPSHLQTPLSAQSGATNAGQPSSPGTPASSQQQSPSSSQSSLTNPGQPSSPGTVGATESFGSRYLKGLDIRPGPLVLWGLLMTLASLALAMYRPRFWRAEREREEYYVRSKQERGLSYRTIEDAAYQHLRNLRFLQTFSSGWSGSLKLPVIEGGVNSVETLAGIQQTLPEVVERFRRFLRWIATTQFSRVAICIDEMDKLESDEKAYAFLNEIKAIFGIENVFYLISVSENAISSFERRGLPFRDVFDSSFDAILRVDYLDLAGSKRLLKRRTTKIPEPFLCFCHCLAGGLPRDLIRACRDVLQMSRETKVERLPELSKMVLANDVAAKVHAMDTALSKSTAEPDRTIFLGKLMELSKGSTDPEQLLNWCSAILVERHTGTRKKALKPGETDAAESIPSSGDSERLASRKKEFAMYLYYAATMLELFSRELSEPEWKHSEEHGVWDQLARVRQALATNPIVGGIQLSGFREGQGLRSLDPSFGELRS